jgi:hypothetical protein
MKLIGTTVRRQTKSTEKEHAKEFSTKSFFSSNKYIGLLIRCQKLS